MGRPETLTKQWLLDHHIVEITEDGRVFKKTKDGEIVKLRLYPRKKSTRYACKTYYVFSIYDKEERKRQKESYEEKGTWAAGNKAIVLSRAMWAWLYDGKGDNVNKVSAGSREFLGGECPPYTAPSGLDIDHKNGDSLDNRFENLQLLTRAENLAKRKGYRNQFEKSLRE